MMNCLTVMIFAFEARYLQGFRIQLPNMLKKPNTEGIGDSFMNRIHDFQQKYYITRSLSTVEYLWIHSSILCISSHGGKVPMKHSRGLLPIEIQTLFKFRIPKTDVI
jgi:hypothetical protein